MSKNFKKNKRSEMKKNSSRSKGYSPKDKDEENRDKKAYGNDISWYVNNPQMLIDACNLSFANPLSKPIPFETANLSGAPDAKYTLDCPGVMCLRVVPTIGSVLRNPSAYQTGDMWDSAVNMAARAEWAFIRQKNAGAKNYDAPDLMMYHLAMDNIYMYWSWMVRLYGYMRLYSFKNKYYPYGILRAMGLTDNNITNLRANLANFRTYINLYASQMSSFAVPTNLPYVRRHLWLFQNTFTDASTTKAQVYLYNPEFLYKLVEVSEGPMRLEPVLLPHGGGPSTSFLSKIKDVGDSLLSAVVKSESAVIMSGDILKAYDPSGIYGFESIPDDFSLVPIYDETVLSQIHNATFVPISTGVAENPEDFSILQDPDIDAGYIYQTLSCGSRMDDAVVIDSRFETPTPTDVMYATRLTTVQNQENDNYLDCGSELAVGFTMWIDATEDVGYYMYGSSQYDNQIYTISSFRGKTGSYGTETMEVVPYADFADFLLFIGNLSKFDWYPLLKMRSRIQDSTTATDVVANILGDVDNFAIAQAETISKMHKVALNSEFGLPYTLVSIK